jgi:hypothetical protein
MSLEKEKERRAMISTKTTRIPGLKEYWKAG